MVQQGKWITVRHGAACDRCGGVVEQGERALYLPPRSLDEVGRLRHERCGGPGARVRRMKPFGGVRCWCCVEAFGRNEWALYDGVTGGVYHTRCCVDPAGACE